MKKPLILIAGPCVVESKEMLFETAEVLTRAVKGLNVEFYFKSSYRKANRTSASSFVGIGDETALGYLSDVAKSFKVKTLTDIHSSNEAQMAAEYVDVLQIPAFLCRQTDVITAAAKTGKVVNIKKGQFVSPSVMLKALDKAKEYGSQDFWITERGTTFGYHDLVVDFRSIIALQESNSKVIYDATHSVQQPSIGEQSGGRKEFIKPLARAALAVGVDGIFFETHPEPSKALSDSASQLALADAEDFIKEMAELYEKL